MCQQLCHYGRPTDCVLSLFCTVNAFHIRLILQEILANPGADSFDSFAEYMKQIEVYLDAVRIILPAPSAGEGDPLKSERQLVCAWLHRVLLDLLCAPRHYVVTNPTTSAANGPARLAQAARRGRPLEHRDSHDRVFRSTINRIIRTIASQPLLFGPLLPPDIPAIPDPPRTSPPRASALRISRTEISSVCRTTLERPRPHQLIQTKRSTSRSCSFLAAE